jgi:hypothetical protein
MLPENVMACIVSDQREVEEFLNRIYIDEDDNALDHYNSQPNIRNPQDMPRTFPCVLGVRWVGVAEVSVLFALDIQNLSDLTYGLVLRGAKLGDVK